MPTSRTIGVFGGSFDPIHTGHLTTVEAVRERLGLDEVLFVPAAFAPHKPNGATVSAYHRFAMVALALQDRPRFRLSDLELRRGGRSFTVDTLRILRDAHPVDEIVLVVGSDSLLSLTTWRSWEEIVAGHRIAVLHREPHDYESARRALPAALASRLAPEGSTLADAPAGRSILWGGNPPDTISSTWLRNAIRAGDSLGGKLPPAVEAYLQKERLYRDAPE